jgi:hypothetical protein
MYVVECERHELGVTGDGDNFGRLQEIVRTTGERESRCGGGVRENRVRQLLSVCSLEGRPENARWCH